MPTLAQICQDHAEDCIHAAAKTDDPKRRDVLLHFAIKWREDAQALRCEPEQWSLSFVQMTKIYEEHAEDCIRTAARTNDTKHRDVLLDLAVHWRNETQALRRADSAPRNQPERGIEPELPT